MGSDSKQTCPQRAAQIVLSQLSQGVRFHSALAGDRAVLLLDLPQPLLTATLQQVQCQLIKAT